MNDFKYFFLMNEIHAHIISEKPKYIVAWRANVWAFEDNWVPRLANIPRIIADQYPQKVELPPINHIPALMKWLRQIGDAIIAKLDNVGNLYAVFPDHPLTPTSPLLPKVIEALKKHGIEAKPQFDTGQGGGTPEPGVMYHGTNTVHLGGILRNGLQPAQAANWDVQTPDRVYLTTDFYTASLHAVRSISKVLDQDRGARAVVIAFKIPDPARLNADYDVDKASSASATRPHQYESTGNDTVYSTSPLQASNHAGLFSYQGTLGPQAIQQVFVSDYGSKFQPMDKKELDRLKQSAFWNPPDFSKNYAKTPGAKPAADPWALPLDDDEEDFGDVLMRHIEPEPAPTPPPQQQTGLKSWWQRWMGQ